MAIPGGPMPLNDADFLDFIYNYFKAEYAPIRSIWSTATAEPRQSHRWLSMGAELSPTSFRPANPRAQVDLESLDYFIRKWKLDATFIRGIVVRYAKYEIHERLEKKLFESSRADLMVRKALREKHVIDALWPSPAPASLPNEVLQQGVQVRRWYGDMFFKYFRELRAVDDFALRPEIEARMKSAGTLMLVPFVDHLVFGSVEPIRAIMVKGAGFATANRRAQRTVGESFGEPDRFEMRFDAPGEVQETVTRSVVRQCQCLKCGTRRDVTVVVSIDPTPGGTLTTSSSKPSHPNTSAPRRHSSKGTQRYTPGYNFPTTHNAAPRRPLAPHVEPHNATSNARSPSPVQKKQCPRCTFLNHADLTVCEMCQAELPETLTAQPPSPEQHHTAHKPAHAHSASMPSNSQQSRTAELRQEERPSVMNRHSLSSTLFSIFPFSQAQNQEHHANLSSTQPAVPVPAPAGTSNITSPAPSPQHRDASPAPRASRSQPQQEQQEDPPQQQRHRTPSPPTTPRLSHIPEMTLMPLSPSTAPSSSIHHRPAPLGLPQNLMDDVVPVSPSYARHSIDDDEDDAGWGEVRREDFKGQVAEEDAERESRGPMVDLDEIAGDVAVWGREE